MSLSVLSLLAATAGAAAQYEPTENYSHAKLQGWTLLISAQFTPERKALLDRTTAVLDQQLFQITRVIPAAPLARLREVPIWIEYRDRGFPCMCYHDSRDWLADNGYNPDKAKAVELANAENFLSWTHEQPWMVFHELSHSYHDRVLGWDQPQIKQAYENAVKSGKYEHVLHYNGRTVRHYALTNDKEYFAECCEAYFGTNDFFPFVRPELEAFDPEIYKLMPGLWGLEQK